MSRRQMQRQLYRKPLELNDKRAPRFPAVCHRCRHCEKRAEVKKALGPALRMSRVLGN